MMNPKVFLVVALLFAGCLIACQVAYEEKPVENDLEDKIRDLPSNQTFDICMNLSSGEKMLCRNMHNNP